MKEPTVVQLKHSADRMSIGFRLYVAVFCGIPWLIERLREVASVDPAAAWGARKLQIYGARLALVGLGTAAALVLVAVLAVLVQREPDPSSDPFGPSNPFPPPPPPTGPAFYP